MLKNLLYLFCFVIFAIILRLYVSHFLVLNSLTNTNFFIFEMLNYSFTLPIWLSASFGILNMILIYYVCVKIYSSNTLGRLSSLIYGISPWIVFLDISGSIYTLLIGLTLLIWIFINSSLKRSLAMSALFSVVLFILFSVDFLMIPVFFLIILFLYLTEYFQTKHIQKNKFFQLMIIGFISLLPIIFLVIRNPDGLRNNFNKEVKIFDDIKLINSLNNLQGELNKLNFGLGRVIENKYTYLGEHLFYTTLNQLAPATYFTQQEKYFGFLNTSPLYFGFIIPFLFYIGIMLKKSFHGFGLYFTIFIILTIPSILSLKSPDLVKASLVSPLIILGISKGYMYLMQSKNRLAKTMLMLSVFLVVFQMIVFIADVPIRESVRFEGFTNTK